jgi:hypothetical protein
MAGGISASFVWNPPPSRTIIPNIKFLRARMFLKLQRNAELFAQRLQSEAQANAPWSDDTGKARAGLVGSSSPNGEGVTIVLAHGAGTVNSKSGYPYGVALETHHGGRYAIIMPTMQKHYGSAMSELTLNLMR